MKKRLCLLLLMVIVSLSSFAQKKRYNVTIKVLVTYHYYEDYKEIGTTKKLITLPITSAFTETPYEAEQKAVQEYCSIFSNIGRDEGQMKYKGRMYDCRSTQKPYSVKATLATD